MYTTLGRYYSKQMVMCQLAHTNHTWVEITLLPIITESSGPKVFVEGGMQPLGSSGARLDDTMGYPPVAHSNKITATIGREGHSDWNISLVSM